MALIYEKMRRLDVRGPASRGIVVDAEGAMLGPDCTLVRRTTAGYRCVRPEAAAAIQKAVFDAREDDPDRLFVLSRGIAKALNDGELALAQIYGLRIPVAGLDSSQLRKLVAAAPWIKANFNPDEPRIPAGEPGAGEWTYGGDDEGNEDAEPRTPPSGRAPAPVAVGTTTAVAATDETAGSVFGTISRTALAALGELAADMAGPAAFLGVLFLPTNSSLISEGTVPGRPDLSYRYDQDTGVLDLFRQDDAGQQLVASGHIGIDGLFHDAAGDVIGRGLGSIVLVDPDALPAPSEEPASRRKRHRIDRSFVLIRVMRTSPAGRNEQSPTSRKSPACRPASQSSSAASGLTVAANPTARCSRPKAPAMRPCSTDKAAGNTGLPAPNRSKPRWWLNPARLSAVSSNGTSPSNRSPITSATTQSKTV